MIDTDPVQDGPGRRRGRASWTTQRWFATVLLAMVVLIVAGAVIGAAALSRTAAVSNRLSDRIAPAGKATVQLGAALADQAADVRGFLLSGDQAFLDSYADSQAQERRLLARLRELLGAEPDAVAQVGAVEEQARQWRTTVADPLVEVRRAGAAADPAGPVARNLAAFEGVSTGVAGLESRLSGLQDAARQDLATTRRVRDGVFIGLVLALLLLIGVVAVLLRVVVLRPLTQLGTAVRQVAGGDFHHRLAPGGPADLARLAGDVEAMRRRLVDGLDASQRAREELEQRQVELHRLNTDLEQFAYVASHDLQEPLRKVASFCQMLQRRYAGALDDRAQQYITFAVDGATRMQQLINDLLAFSRIGRLYDASRPVDLDEVLDGVQQTLALSIAESGAEITRPPLPTVVGDPTLLSLLWQNLLGNAMKFRHPERAPKVEIEAAQAQGWWTFSVKDNGIGIAPEFADKIFVIFQRLHPREAYAGTGIGLAICKKIVEHHGGTIRLDAAHSPGACLTFTLPAA
ncbi:ATP-binding protein [Couchioplanes caeruleus]|uniref:sensor histidine kinase n=1 Tax=Couchioplanes caeruleus TaxID=56438 RepID=UPI0020BF5AB3|nr:sensor histidine kinase [Couchioplanes caeruleus]UQU62452.1 ATP-binding protein [Couchioplanes caeruleus]